MCSGSRFVLRFLALAILLIAATTATADQIVVNYSFERPRVEPVSVSGESFDRIVMPGAPNCGRIGEPALPAIGADLLIPFGQEVTGIEIFAEGKTLVGDNYFIEPVPKQYKLSVFPDEVEPPTPDEEIYSSPNPFPSEKYDRIGQYGFRGFQILVLKLKPVEYVPATGELFYYSGLTVVINTADGGRVSDLYRGLEEDFSEVQKRVDNPEAIDSYYAAGYRGTKNYDLLIITTTSLASSFAPLKAYHDANGIATEIHTTNDVGGSSPDDVRNYITARYLNDGIQYVIIGADDDILPAKDLFVRMSYPGGEAEYNMPSDFYFGCLDGTFNYDGDSYWGEPTDGEGGGDVDLFHEVYIGRASVGNTTEADRFVTKTLEYVGENDPYLQNMVLVGEYLGFGGPSEYAAETLDELVDGSDAHGYTTVGIPSDVYTIDKLYDRDWPGNDWPKTELTNRINAGRHVVNHLGHGSPDYAMKLYDSDIMSLLNNTDLAFVYSQTCLAGHFDGTDCWAEYANIKTDYGAFAVVMNARYGFGEFNSTDGASQRFNREFWDAVFSTSEGKPELGRANADSKEDNAYRITDDYMRWCFYELNLFGDPAISIKGVNSIAFNYPQGIPETVTPGEETSFEVVVSGVGEGIPVPGSGRLHYDINKKGYQIQEMTEIEPNHYQAVLPPIDCGDLLEYYISAEEVSNGPIYDPDPENPHAPPPVTGYVTFFTDDFETAQAWTVSGGAWARGTPTGNGGDHGGPDPQGGHNSTNCFGYNLNGDYTNDMPEYHLTSPAIDCSGYHNIELNFWRWLGVEQPTYDHAYVRVSTDGTNWTTVWQNSSEITDTNWVEMTVDISEVADDQPTVYLRWTMGETDVGWTYCGWNIDDISISGYECRQTDPLIVTQELPDWTVNMPYSIQLQATGGMGTLTWADKFGDLTGTGLTLSTEGLLSGTPTATGSISFTAVVTDENLVTDERAFDFGINPEVGITTESLPSIIVNTPYSVQLEAVGGTGTLAWSDRDGDLEGTGITLDAAGLLSGTPTQPATINFTAMVEDVCGCYDENPFTFEIVPEFLCGDVDADDVVDLLDILYLIQYKYKDGPAPEPLLRGDVNNDGEVDILDIIHLIKFKYKDGPEPYCGYKGMAAKN